MKVKGSDDPNLVSSLQKSVMGAVERHQGRAMGVVEERAAQASEAEKAYAAIKEIAGHEDEVLPKNRVKLVLGSAEKMSLYHNILDRLNVEKSNQQIAHDVVEYVLGFLSEKERTANTKGAKKGPIFRRSE